MLQIRVEEDQVALVRRRGGRQERLRLAPVDPVPEHAEAVPATGLRRRQAARVVTRSVVDKDDFAC